MPFSNTSTKLSASAAAARRRARARKVSVKLRVRMDEVSEMLRSLVPRRTIIRELAKKWGVTDKVVDRVISHVHQEWAYQASDPEFVDKQRNTYREGWYNLHLRALSQKDLRTAAYALRELGRLDGCYPADRLEVNAAVTGVGIHLAHLGFKSPEEVHARLDELRARLASHGPAALSAGEAANDVIDVQPAADGESAVDNPEASSDQGSE